MDYFEKRDNVSLREDETHNVTNQFVNMGSEIQKFYENKNVLVTEASGLGGLLVERLLRSCPKLGTIFLLMKPEKNKLYEERLEVFLSKFHKKVNQNRQFFETKIKIVNCDFTRPRCGISEFDQKLLNDEIHIVFHCAGAAKKYENLKSLNFKNIQSTKNLLEMATKMKKLKAFIYVSTMHAKNFQSEVEENFHETLFSNNNFQSWEEQLQLIAPKILERRGEFNDFTKAVAEEVVRMYNGKIPIAIARSSNEGSNYKDDNWEKHLNVPTETFSTLITALKCCACETKKNSITTDNFINTILAISWQIGEQKSNRNHMNTPAYDVIPSWNSRIPTNCGEYLTEDTDIINKAILKHLEKNELNEKNYNWMHHQNNYVYPFLFLLMLELYLKIYSNIYKLLNTFVKQDDCCPSSDYYHSKAWGNKPTNLDKLWSSLSNVDKKIFNFYIFNNEWKHCNSRNIRNMIAHTFKEDLGDSEMNNANYARYQQAKMCLKTVLYGFSVYYILSRGFLILLKTVNKLFF